MEELERSLFHADTSIDCNGLPSHTPFIPPNDTVMEDAFTDDPLDSKEPKLLDINHTELEMHQICMCCLSTYNVSHMKDIFIKGIPSVAVYEKISNIKVEMENISVGMCLQCVGELTKIDKFIDMLKGSYTVLFRAAQEMKKLNNQGDINAELYNIKKTNILREVLREKYVLPCESDFMKLHEKSTKENCQQSDDDDDDDDRFSDNGANNFSLHNESESSEDEVPLSERFKVNLKNSKECDKTTRRINKKNDQNKKDLPRKGSVKSKENLPDNTLLNIDKEKIEPLNKEILQDTCPLCLKKFRHLIKHLHSIHSLDWNDSKCLQCSYTNADKDKLVEHCKGCSNVEIKYDNSDYVEAEELKLEWTEETDECDPDFEPDELERDEMEEIDIEAEQLKKSHSNTKKGRHKKYSCNKCKNVSFKQYEDIETHLKTVHSSESKCILCHQEFTNSFSLLYHMMVKHGKLKCCRLCLVSFKDSEELNIHYKSEEHNTKCTVCGEQFRNRKALYEHRRKKHLNPQLENQKYKCPECPKEFANQNNIRRHIMVAHNDLRFLCDTCGQSYTTKRNLKLHIQKFHEGVQVQNKNTKKNFFCEACGRELKIFHKYAIAMHRAKHKGHNFVCKKCYDSFPTEQDFKQHVEEHGHQLYECDKCQSQFVREENFKIHLKNHDAPGWNKNMFATWGKSAKLRNEKGEFVCSYCPKVFKDKQRLDNHVRVHTNERPYKCHICSKGFKTWIHRKTHLNIHLGIKKWVCKFCGKAFTNSCTLKGHEMIHTGERPHRCLECKKGFITMSAMKKHRMVHFRTGGPSYGKKDKTNTKDDDKTDSEHEENVEFIYKYGQMFTGGDVSYESFSENPKEPPIGLVSIEKEQSC